MNKVIYIIILIFAVFMMAGKAQVNENTLSLWKNEIKKTSIELGKYNIVQLEKTIVNDLYKVKKAKFSFSFKDEKNNLLVADMALKSMDDVKIKINNKAYVETIDFPLQYVGKIRNYTGVNHILITLAPEYISFQAMLQGVTLSLEKEDRPGSSAYILYNSKDIKLTKKMPYCGLPEPTLNDLQRLKKAQLKTTNKLAAPFDKCVFIYVDCTTDLFEHYGSDLQNTVNNIYTIWNDVRTAFNNEQLNVAISEVNVWTGGTPFNTSTRESGIQTFAAYYQNNYWGNMAMLLDWTTGGNNGVAGGYGWAKGIAPNVCGNYNPNPVPDWNHGSYIYNDLNYFGNYQNFPVASRADEVYSCVHEIGHLLGSEHTHSCNWPGGPIDNCAPVEGTCTAGPAPVNGGTFMSYCIGAGEFMNFNNGFGPLPGGVIRGFVDGNDCLTNCITCFFDRTVGAIPFQGIYQYEATNQITANGIINGNSATIVKIDAGNRVVLSPGFKATLGGKVKIFVDGCGGIR